MLQFSLSDFWPLLMHIEIYLNFIKIKTIWPGEFKKLPFCILSTWILYFLLTYFEKCKY